MSDYILTVEEASKLDVDCPPSVGSYRCNKCKHKFEGFTNRRMIDYKFCPYCGKSLYKDNEDYIKPVTSSSIPEIKCPIDLNKFVLGVPFENIFSGEECEKAKFYGDCFHCWSSSIAKRDKQADISELKDIKKEIEIYCIWRNPYTKKVLVVKFEDIERILDNHIKER